MVDIERGELKKLSEKEPLEIQEMLPYF